MAAFVAKIAPLERDRIRERILAGLERARAEGTHRGIGLAVGICGSQVLYHLTGNALSTWD